MKVRLKDVAARAGVAVNTASTILNRRPNSWASKETEARVFKAAADLGYRPNRAAVGLRFGKFNTLALLLADLHNPYYTAFADLLGREAERRGYDLLIESWRTDLAREQHCLVDVSDRQADGVAAFLSDNEPHRPFLETQAAARRPFVALASAGGEPLPVDSVLVEFNRGLREAVDTLFDLEHRRFAFLCALAPGQSDGHRVELFRRLLDERGIGGDGFDFVRCDHSIGSAHAVAKELLRRPDATRPTALIALNDLSAIGAMRAAAELGLEVPGRLSIVGVDDIPFARFLPVSLSTIAQPLEEMAEATTRLLIRRVDDGTGEYVPERVVFPTKFVRRESIGPAPRNA